MSKILKHHNVAWPPVDSQPIPTGKWLQPEPSANSMLPSKTIDEIDLEAMMEDARRVSEELLQNARISATRLIEEAQARVETITLEAQQHGYEDGVRRGREDAGVAMAAWRADEEDKLTKLAESLLSQHAAQVEVMESILRSFVVAAVEKLLYRELTSSPADVAALVHELLTYVMQSTSIQVRVHPDDYLLARQALPRWKVMKYGDWDIAIVPDRTLSRGDCEIQGDTGRVDARLRTRLDELERSLEGLMLREEESVRGTDA